MYYKLYKLQGKLKMTTANAPPIVATLMLHCYISTGHLGSRPKQLPIPDEISTMNFIG